MSTHITIKMADNSDEKKLEISKNEEAKIRSEEIVPIKEVEAIITNKETENMEVHQHAHHEGKRNWKSYFWEFLMLFLAVFCGFLAEYQLEHSIEKERGKQFVQSMINDLSLDITKIKESLEFCKQQELGLDSLGKLLLDKSSRDSNINLIYHLSRKYTFSYGTVLFTKRTIAQLENAGGMRLIANQNTSNEITKYSENAEVLEYQGEIFLGYLRNDVTGLSKKLLDFNDFENSKLKLITDKKLAFVVNDEKLLKEYGFAVMASSKVLGNYNNFLAKYLNEIPEIIERLKKENHIE